MDQRRNSGTARLARGVLAENSVNALGARLLARFARVGFAASDVPVLQPAEPFLELSGEDIRRRLFVTSDDEGEELCLRPEFTIPAALAYLKSGIVGRRADLAFLGPVFRQRPGENAEFWQFSAESLGRTDREAADADLLAEVHGAVTDEIGAEGLTLRVGDLALFARLIETLNLSPVLARRLGLALGEGRIEALLEAPLAGGRPEAKAFVKDLLSLAGISAVGGRSAEDIASRFLDRAREDSQALGEEPKAILRRFLSISGEPDQVSRAVRALAEEAGLDLSAVLERFDLRTGFLEARGFTLSTLQASAGFARNLDYYSGFVFELRRAGTDRPVAAGGRYDRLFERLGHEVPAIGAAIWLERLAGDAP
jgi:ATP phosphoribosyltransferase regulatory subunit